MILWHLREAPLPPHAEASGHASNMFYFHVTTAYDILRHNGVTLGKRDYLGTLSQD